MRGIIIAGGFGTRLRPLTYGRPKAIVPLMNRPFLEYQISLLRDHGMREIVLNLHYMPEKVREVLGDGSQLGVRLIYSVESEPLGTGGAMKLAEPHFGDEPIVVLNGDVLFDLDISALIAFHRRKESEVTITLIRVPDPTSYGLVMTDSVGRVLKFLEKPRWDEVTAYTVNAGAYVMNPKIFCDVPAGKQYSIERDLYPSLLRKGSPMFGFVMDGYWNDIGNPERYLEAHRDILHGDAPFPNGIQPREDAIYIDEKAKVDSSAKIYGPCLIGPGTVIGPEVQIHSNVTLGSGVTVGEGTELHNSVIWENSRIGEKCNLDGVVLGAGVVVENEVRQNKAVFADGSTVKKGS